MKRAHSERARQETAQSTAYQVGQGLIDPAPWIGMTGAAWSEGLKWMELWQREIQRLWGIGPTMFALRGPRREGDLRRASDMPWLPRLEAQVIPLRRNTDPPGGEATRFSVRLPMPWAGAGANLVAVEAIVGAPDTAAREQAAREQAAEGRDEGAPESA